MRAEAAYDELMRRTREEALLASCAELLGWDEVTYMPRGGAAHRSEQMAYLAGLQHDLATHPRVSELLAAIEGSDLLADPLSPAAVNVREVRRVTNRLLRLPRALVEELARVTTFAQQEWVTALERADYPHLRPWLEKIIALKQCEAQCLGAGQTSYDALLEEYEPGATGTEVAHLFNGLRRDLVPLLAAIRESPRRPDTGILRRYYALDRQCIFGEAVAGAVGFDFRRGRLDTTAHPFFSTIGPGDCRITTRYDPHHFGEGFFGILHEVGHGLYEQGLDPAHHGTPMGEAASLGLHESQSRLWENLVGRSRPFWQHFYPQARQVFHDTLADVGLEEFHFAVNAVEPSLNRVRADEVTYNLHILVRFELEQALLSGELIAADLPGAWNDAYRDTLGVVPRNDAEGCLQDGHWASGMFGYFPTYTLGNVFAAQLFGRATQDLGGLASAFAAGDFSGLLGWLRDKVHRQGHRYSAVRLIEQATGTPPDPRPLIQGLHAKYTELYRL